LIFTIFHYIEDIQQPTTQITYIDNNSIPVRLESEPNKNKETSVQEKTITKDLSITEETTISNQGGGASNNADNVMMLAIPETTLEPEMRFFPINDEPIIEDEPVAEYAMMKAMTIEEDANLAFCETSNQFLLANNITENATKTFTYENQIYKATINFTSNSINIDHIGTQDDSKIQTELPNLNLFFEKNNFNIKSDYLSPIIEESEKIIEYYYPKNNQQE